MDHIIHHDRDQRLDDLALARVGKFRRDQDSIYTAIAAKLELDTIIFWILPCGRSVNINHIDLAMRVITRSDILY
jgi:hypothetical protein